MDSREEDRCKPNVAVESSVEEVHESASDSNS
ncbi:hypothetical protein JOF46_002457 [Paeniglutamicibacter psychrophenolicus]|uniref:Uncharacterized protein n=1 Tax=Paeniglutamicibacter psychrophenolicus TaxID=257454 RepID=A0ABS4WEF3_9MICC|nr:hypothetical protein [Paeniglutamicibacter psychrophenolicus]